jgi:hypothetical protein
MGAVIKLKKTGENDAAEVYWKALKNENPHKSGKAVRGNRGRRDLGLDGEGVRPK